MSNTPRYTYADLERSFGFDRLQKAQAFLNGIEHMSITPYRVSATVKAGPTLRYRTDVEIAAPAGGAVRFNGRCTCQAQRPCEHIAALLLVALQAREQAPTAPNPVVLAWLDSFRLSITRPDKAKSNKAAPRDTLFYLLGHRYGDSGDWRVRFLKGRLGSEGHPVNASEWNNMERALLQPPRFVGEDDLSILRLLWAQETAEGRNYYGYGLNLQGRYGEEILQRLLDSNRLFFEPRAHAALSEFRRIAAGEPRAGRLTWRHDPDGRLVPRIDANPKADVVIPLDNLWYVDVAQGEAGLVQLPFPAKQAIHLLSIPPLAEPDLPAVAGALAEIAPEIPTPVAAKLRVIETEPQPVLVLGTLDIYNVHGFRSYTYRDRTFDYAEPHFRYGEILVKAERPAEFVVTPEGETVQVKRQPKLEARWINSLKSYGLAKVPGYAITAHAPVPHPLFGLEHESVWPDFVTSGVPKLQAAGWEVVMPPGFRHKIIEIEAWEADIHEDESGWFDLDLGIVVEGRRIPLAPLLYDLFRRDDRWLDAQRLEQLPDREAVLLVTAEGEQLKVPAERLKPLARTLIDLFDALPTGKLRFSRLDAPRLADLADLERWQFKGMEAVQKLAERLLASHGIKSVRPPEGFALQLRPYQLEGLAWLQFLREQELSGILADDMGLGKTAQALAHLLLEKEAGRLDQPALVVLPTSLIFNWKREAERFAPALRVLSLHGADRKQRFPLIPEHDVVLTTYPLLWRDQESLTAYGYHLLILDEAQTVKNAASQGAQVVRGIKARHRLCLTGTPLENHLGELWAQFDFLLPGFFGDSKSFTRTWRTPIEKHGDRLRRDLLARRVRPFILRRRKEDVAKELPEKTIIVRSVELEGGQRDLYETVRSAMNERVRETIAEKGFARSQIIILDALLKLRQVCCDPRLLKLDSARKVKERAKLDLLMDMLPELVQEGRRVLVFSQFTSMLDLIAPELDKRKLPFVTLTGDTKDRETVIRRFQDGEVPIFLISLKAGGVGLNLTAADTVIHYDPWWNPAVENQATDRAHRLGQTKRVFVYKLVVAGSIEEKILALQEKKADLAAGVLSEDTEALGKFGETDIKALFEPLPEVEK
jgi:superfamily II DNA or RNA helicase